MRSRILTVLRRVLPPVRAVTESQEGRVETGGGREIPDSPASDTSAREAVMDDIRELLTRSKIRMRLTEADPEWASQSPAEVDRAVDQLYERYYEADEQWDAGDRTLDLVAVHPGCGRCVVLPPGVKGTVGARRGAIHIGCGISVTWAIASDAVVPLEANR